MLYLDFDQIPSVRGPIWTDRASPKMATLKMPKIWAPDHPPPHNPLHVPCLLDADTFWATSVRPKPNLLLANLFLKGGGGLWPPVRTPNPNLLLPNQLLQPTYF